MVVVVAPGHVWTSLAKLSPDDLLQGEWVMREPGSGTRSVFEDDLMHVGIEPHGLRVVLELPSNEAVRAAVEAGLGATAISATVAAPSIEAGLLHQVGRADRLRSEPQVRYGLRARLLRVVDEVPLRVQVPLGAEDLDRVLVRADRAVRTEAEEDRADGAGRLDVQGPVIWQAQAGHVVDDADREPGSRPVSERQGRSGVGPSRG